MTVNIEALKASLAKIEQLGQDELTFPAGDSQITLRALKASEELEVEKYGQAAWEDASSDEDPSALTDYLDRMRIATLSHVIVQIDGMDLRDVEFVETGEVGSDGTPIRKQRFQVLRDLIGRWNRQVIHRCYLKYSELMMQIELNAGHAIKFDVKNIDDEISRIQKRLSDLQDMKESAQTKASEETAASQRRSAVNALGEHREQNITQAAVEAERKAFMQDVSSQPTSEGTSEPVQPQLQPQQRTQPRTSPIPQRGAPPPRPPSSPETDAMGIPVPHDGDSMFDPTDGDAAMHAEHQRLLEHRRRMQQNQQPPPEQVTTEVPTIPPEQAPPTGRKPPHRDALNTADAVMTFEDGQPVSARPKGANAEVQGYRLPTETLSDRTRGQGVPPSRGAKAPVNQPPRGSKNPRFRGPSQG